MTFLEAAASAVRMAKDVYKLCYVFELNGEYLISSEYVDNWLFAAYPGGRKILSIAGKKLQNHE
jgi:hypothetical protein